MLDLLIINDSNLGELRGIPTKDGGWSSLPSRTTYPVNTAHIPHHALQLHVHTKPSPILNFSMLWTELDFDGQVRLHSESTKV